MDFQGKPRPPKKTKRHVGCLWFCAFLIVILIIAYQFYPRTIISPLSEERSNGSLIDRIMRKEKNPDTLRNAIQQQIGNSWKNYSVYVVDYTSTFSMGINESTIFTAASINKVPILAALYAEAKKGAVDFDKVITLQQEDIQDYGTGSIRYDPPGSTYSVKTLARLMMQKSDNTAAYLLANYIIGFDTVQTYVNGWGMTQTDMANNKTSNKDMAVLFRLIVNKQVTTPSLSDEILDFLRNSDFEDRIPALLPKDAIVYHKVGTGIGDVHDVGVVVDGKMKYYIGIFSSDVTDEEQASKLASEVSKTIFDFMKK